MTWTTRRPTKTTPRRSRSSVRPSSLLVGLATALLALVGLVAHPAPAHAHANLVQSDPPAGAVLPEAPRRVTLFFSEEVEPGFSSIVVYDHQRRQVDLGDAGLAPGDARTMAVSLPPLP
ncbi:MAG TPA: copper resistance CopC family protein, partial [Chloroflexota bacterium]